jgi:UDP-N-acetylmuramate dehydrogenase
VDDRALLDELLEVARKLGVPVRIEPFETPAAGGGGLCVVHGRDLVLLDAGASPSDRVRALARALAGLDVDAVYMAPEARELVESMSPVAGRPREAVALAPLCTMGVGGPARFFVEAETERAVLDAFDWAARRDLPLRILGGGSNLVVADGGVDALVLKPALREVTTREVDGAVELTAGAGEPWDDLVRLAVEQGWAGLECLSGIPGLVGATPIQNVGAYGQDVSETVTAVRALDRATGRVVTLDRAACGFAYRDSVFKSGEPDRYVVLAVTYRLTPGGPPAVRYPELARHLAARGRAVPSLEDVRESVRAIRRAKSMVLEADDPNRRSCGSFFVNPIVTAEQAARVETIAGDPAMPRWPQPDGRVKLAGAWLIERAGIRRGEMDGAVGLSTRHALAVVSHEGARAADVGAFARRIRARVEAHFGVRLVPEPVFWGFARLEDGLPAPD